MTIRIETVIPKEIDIVFSMSLSEARLLEQAICHAEIALKSEDPAFSTLMDFHEVLSKIVEDLKDA